MSRVQIEISLGIILVLVTGTLLVAYGLGEEERMARFERIQHAQAVEVGAELFTNNCSGCHGPQGEGVLGLAPPLNDRHFFTNRLAEVGWSGSLEDYIISTVSGGRLTSTRPDLYAGQGNPAMPSWSEAFGGPLRADQIRDLAAFILNWEATAPDRQLAQAPASEGVGSTSVSDLPAGDAQRGETIAAAQGCVGCHISTATGPAWLPSDGQAGIGERAEARLSQADYNGAADTAEGYLLESIVKPNLFVVEGYTENLMPGTYASALSTQDAADLIAYLLSLK